MEFKLPDNVIKELAVFEEKHNKECFNKYHDASGALLSYTFVPTGLGNVFKCECSCGCTFSYDDDSNNIHISNASNKESFLPSKESLLKHSGLFGLARKEYKVNELYYFLNGLYLNEFTKHNISKYEDELLECKSLEELLDKIKSLM